MTVTLDEKAERLLTKQLQTGAFASAAEAVQAAVQQAFGGEATPELEALLDEALNHPGRRIPMGDQRVSRGRLSDLDDILANVPDVPPVSGDEK